MTMHRWRTEWNPTSAFPIARARPGQVASSAGPTPPSNRLGRSRRTSCAKVGNDAVSSDEQFRDVEAFRAVVGA